MSLVYNSKTKRPDLYYFDIYPKVFLVGEKTVTIKPISIHKNFAGFDADTNYYVQVLEYAKSSENRFVGTNGFQNFVIKPEADGTLKVSAKFENEGKYFINVFAKEDYTERILQMKVYALEEDMKGRYPWRGDLHMHTCRSDGSDAPEIVASNYRAYGLDFMVISDHHKYYPSLEAREALHIKNDESDITDFLVVQGEEIHLPYNSVHTVHFGGEFSINALVTPCKNQEKDKDNPKYRSLNGNCPDPMTEEEYEIMIREAAKSIPREIESERLSFASSKWIYEKVKEANGLCIFAHPYWACPTIHLSEDYLDFYYKERPFDAFEVLGGKIYYSHNGFQTNFYYTKKAEGMDYPIVGSTDSHGSTEMHRNACIASTIVFAKDNKVPELISSIKDKYSVAVDTISPEYRLVGDFRLVKYASFLMEEWYPLHDEATKAEGYFLKEFVTGNENAEKVLKAMKGTVPNLIKKYFDI